MRELTPEEATNLTNELQDVLKKYNAEMGVRSHIELLIREEADETEKTPEVEA